MHELALRVACHLHSFLVNLVRLQQADTFFPNFYWFAHRYPNVGIEEVATLNALCNVVGNSYLSAGFLCNLLAGVDKFLARLQFLRSNDTYIHTHLCTTNHQRVTHVETSIAEVCKSNLVERLVNVFAHSEEVGKYLCRVEFVGQTVPYWYTSVLSKFFNSFLLETTVFDTIIHSSENASGILHRFLNANL